MKPGGIYMGLAVTVGVLAACTGAWADERNFAYVYEANVLPLDAVEFEQLVSGSFGRDDLDSARERIQTRLVAGINF